MFCKMPNAIISTPLDDMLGDFFVTRSTIVPALKGFKDRRLFLKCIYSWIGFERDVLNITIEDHAVGQPKFNFLRRFRLGVEGIIWLTIAPLYFFDIFGLLMAATSFLFGLFFVLKFPIIGVTVPGFYTIAVLQTFVRGMIMLSLGVITLYLSVTYENTSSRPGFTISSVSSAKMVVTE